MKKIILGLSIIASASSCKKEYTCECKSIETENGNSVETVIDTKSSEIKMSKKTALDWCSQYGGYSETGPDYEYKEECELK